MTHYTHPDLPGIHGDNAFTLGEVQYPSVWWGTVSLQKIAGMGFVKYEAPEPEPPTFEQAKALKLEAIRANRWQVETGGTTINGAPIRTDEVSQAKITGAVNLFANDPTLDAIDWEAQPGVWVTIDEVAMTAIGVAAGRHVQACFSRARVLSEAVEAATDQAELDAVDIEAGWPA